nr:unnamed protein product [Digitaria exilis]
MYGDRFHLAGTSNGFRPLARIGRSSFVAGFSTELLPNPDFFRRPNFFSRPNPLLHGPACFPSSFSLSFRHLLAGVVHEPDSSDESESTPTRRYLSTPPRALVPQPKPHLPPPSKPRRRLCRFELIVEIRVKVRNPPSWFVCVFVACRRLAALPSSAEPPYFRRRAPPFRLSVLPPFNRGPGQDCLYKRLDRLGPVAGLAMCQATSPPYKYKGPWPIEDLYPINNPRFAASDGVPPEVVIVGFHGASATGGLTGPYRRSSSEEIFYDRAI